MAIQWPAVKAALVSTWLAAAESDDAVYPGVPTTDDLPARWVMVGYQDVGTGASYGRWQQTLNSDGVQYDEVGEVHCQIEAQSGDDQSITEQSAFDFYAVLDAAVRNSKRLGGVISGNGFVDMSGELFPYASGSGSRSVITVTVTYTTTTL